MNVNRKVLFHTGRGDLTDFVTLSILCGNDNCNHRSSCSGCSLRHSCARASRSKTGRCHFSRGASYLSIAGQISRGNNRFGNSWVDGCATAARRNSGSRSSKILRDQLEAGAVSGNARRGSSLALKSAGQGTSTVVLGETLVNELLQYLSGFD
jgi:hypothetical protein